MFKKTDDGRERPSTPARATPAESAISIIGPGMQIQGDIVTDGTIRIEGALRGSVRAAKAVVLGKDGEVVGEIITQDAVIGGRVDGTIVAESRLELQSTCVVEGEIRARMQHLKLDEGARFNGQIQMIDGDEPRAALPAPAAPRAKREAPPEAQAEAEETAGGR